MNTKEINWNVSKFEHSLIVKIAERVEAVIEELNLDVDYPRHTIIMDLTACHANGMPLDLAGLLAAPRGDFGHDVFGIRRHINRSTGEIEGCFVPRCAMPQTATA